MNSNDSNEQSATIPPHSEALWSEFHERLRSFLSRRVHSNDVEDILQDIFLRIHRSLTNAEMPRDPVAWIHRVARTTVIDHYRKRASQESVVHPSAKDETSRVSLDQGDPSAREELSRCVTPLVERLPENQREALTWTAFDGLTQAEAASRAGVSVSGMKSRVQRARQALAKSFLACCTIEFDARGTPTESNCDKC